MAPLAAAGRVLFDRPYLLLTLTQLFWAVNMVLARYIVGTIPPIALAQIRWTGAMLLLAPFAWHHLKRDWPAIRRSLPLMLVLSLTGIACYNTMAYWGLQSTQAINGVLMQSTAPVLIGVWSFVLFGDRLAPAQIAGILVSLAGVLTIIVRGDPTVLTGLSLNPGDLWIVAALAIYGLYSALLRKGPAIHFLSLLLFTIAAGQAMTLPVFAWEMASGRFIDPTPAAFAVLAYIMVFPSLVAYAFFNRGVALIGANRAGPFFHLAPVFGSLLAIVFLGERFQWFHAAGYALILGGIVAAQRGARGKAVEREQAAE